MTTTWHASDLDLAEYLDGTITHVHAASVETHLLGCHECRRRLAEARTGAPADSPADAPVDPRVERPAGSAGSTGSPAAVPAPAPARQDRVWARIADGIDQPDRRLHRLDAVWVRTIFGSPALAGATLAAVAAVLALPLVVDAFSLRVAVTLLMGLAPIAPALGVVAAFRPGNEPSGEMGRVTPLGATRLLLRRALVVAVAALPAGLLATLLLPVPPGRLLIWVIPGLAFTAVTLALATHGDPTRPALGLALGWAAVGGALAMDLRHTTVTRALADWPVSQPGLQALLAVVAVVAAVDAATRRDVRAVWSEA
jgi:hypothetical protein